jgi:hypothetical protein
VHEDQSADAAVASCEASEASEAALNEATAIVLVAKARIGELTAALAKVPAGKRRGSDYQSVSQKRDALKRIAAENPYPDMMLDEIADLPTATVAQKNAVLWLWTTNILMEEACLVVCR